MEAKLYGQNKGGTSINGIIKDYYAYAGENISAGDLVEYVNGIAGKTEGTSVDTVINTADKFTGYRISAVALDNNRVFVAHSYGSDYHLYGVVLNINGATISAGTDVALNTVLYSGYAIDTLLLPDGRVFIAHSYNGNYSPYATVVSIDGTTIAIDISQELDGTDRGGYVLSAELLPNGNVFIAHSRGTDLDLYAMVVSINGNTLTVGSDTSLNGTNKTGYAISTCLLPNGNVFVAHCYGSSYTLYGIVCTISGTTISKGTDTSLVNSQYAGSEISAISLDNGKVFIAHCYGSNHYLYGIVCSVSGTTITAGTDTKLTSAAADGNKLATLLLSNGDVFLAHSGGESNYYSYVAIVGVSGTTITVHTDTKINSLTKTGYTVSPCFLTNDIIFMAHCYGSDYHLYAQIWGIDDNKIPTNHIIAPYYETQVRKVTTGLFDGVAKTSGLGGDGTAHNEIVSIWTKE